MHLLIEEIHVIGSVETIREKRGVHGEVSDAFQAYPFVYVCPPATGEMFQKCQNAFICKILGILPNSQVCLKSMRL
jgi:hypothetical protein